MHLSPFSRHVMAMGTESEAALPHTTNKMIYVARFLSVTETGHLTALQGKYISAYYTRSVTGRTKQFVY